MPMTREETAEDYTRRVWLKAGKAKKALGQNYLIDTNIINQIVWEGIPPGDFPLVEIGPGPGTLTRELLKRSPDLWAVELDKQKVEFLQKEFSGHSLKVLHMDALKLNLEDLWGRKKGWLVGNLPYYAANPLLAHFLEQAEFLRGMTVMVQKEVADRIIAVPGSKNFGILSISVQIYAQVSKLVEVPPSAFIPQPKVTSAVLMLTIQPYPGFAADRRRFFHVVKAAFGQRRKTILNALTSGLKVSKQEMSVILRNAGIEETLRPESIGILEYQRITEQYIKQLEINRGD